MQTKKLYFVQENSETTVRLTYSQTVTLMIFLTKKSM